MELRLEKSIFHTKNVNNGNKLDIVLNVVSGKACVDFIYGGEKVYYYLVEKFSDFSKSDYTLMMEAGNALIKEHDRWINVEVCKHLAENIQFYHPMSRETIYTLENEATYKLNLLYFYRDNQFRMVFCNDENDDVITCTAKASSFEELQEKVNRYLEVMGGMAGVFASNISSFLDSSFTKFTREA